MSSLCRYYIANTEKDPASRHLWRVTDINSEVPRIQECLTCGLNYSTLLCKHYTPYVANDNIEQVRFTMIYFPLLYNDSLFSRLYYIVRDLPCLTLFSILCQTMSSCLKFKCINVFRSFALPWHGQRQEISN